MIQAHATPEWFHLTIHVLVILWIIWSLRDLPKAVAAFNQIGTQPVALIVLLLGSGLLVISKWYGIDTAIAGGVIGAAINMLTNHNPKGENPLVPAQPGKES